MSRIPRFRRVLPVVVALGVAVSSAAAAQGVEAPRLALRTVIDELNSTRASYAEAYNAKNAAEVTAFYLPEAILILPDGSQIMGATAIGEAMKKEAPTWPHIVLTSDTVRVYGGTAVDFGTVKLHPKAGGEEKSRYMAVLRRGLRGWKLASVAQVPVKAKTGS